MHDVLVSIGLPTYNRPIGLERSLNTLLNQTYHNLEIIISDNCSEIEDVQRFAEGVAKVDERVRYFRQDRNIGPIDNFGFVLRQATGKYFMWAADDDFWDPKFVECLVEKLEQSPDAVSAFCNIEEINQENIVTNQFVYSDKLSDSNLFNRTKYFLSLKEGSFGKASLVFGLHKLGNIRDIFLDSDYNYYSCDNIMILKLLCCGPIVLEDKFLYKVGAYNEKLYEPTLGKLEGKPKPKTYTEAVFGYMAKRRNYFSKSNTVIRGNFPGFYKKNFLIWLNYRKELLFVADDLLKLGRNRWYNIKGHGFAFLKSVVRMTK